MHTGMRGDQSICKTMQGGVSKGRQQEDGKQRGKVTHKDEH